MIKNEVYHLNIEYCSSINMFDCTSFAGQLQSMMWALQIRNCRKR